MSPKYFLPVFLDDPPRRAPCPRNRQIYDAVKVQRTTHRAAAAQFNLSVARIGQIVTQVEGWIGRTGGTPARAPRERLRISEHLHRERAEACFDLLLHGFNEGRETSTHRVKVVADKPEERIATVQTIKKDPRYVVAAWQIETMRHAFEVGRSQLPPEELTPAERIREAGIIAAETVAEAEEKFKADNVELKAEADDARNAYEDWNPTRERGTLDELGEPTLPDEDPSSLPATEDGQLRTEEPIASVPHYNPPTDPSPAPPVTVEVQTATPLLIRTPAGETELVAPPPTTSPKPKLRDRSDQPQVIFDRHGRIIYQYIPAPKSPPVDQGHYFGPRQPRPGKS